MVVSVRHRALKISREWLRLQSLGIRHNVIKLLTECENLVENLYRAGGLYYGKRLVRLNLTLDAPADQPWPIDARAMSLLQWNTRRDPGVCSHYLRGGLDACRFGKDCKKVHTTQKLAALLAPAGHAVCALVVIQLVASISELARFFACVDREITVVRGTVSIFEPPWDCRLVGLSHIKRWIEQALRLANDTSSLLVRKRFFAKELRVV